MTKMSKLIAAFVVTIMILLPVSIAWAGDIEANKKRGRVYFKMVCTVCHIQTAAKVFPPNSYTMDEWRAYMDADQHDLTKNTNPSVKYYLSKEYRESVKDTNKAARKFLTLSEEQLYADVREFVISGAKDSDTPASCE